MRVDSMPKMEIRIVVSYIRHFMRSVCNTTHTCAYSHLWQIWMSKP